MTRRFGRCLTKSNRSRMEGLGSDGWCTGWFKQLAWCFISALKPREWLRRAVCSLPPETLRWGRLNPHQFLHQNREKESFIQNHRFLNLPKSAPSVVYLLIHYLHFSLGDPWSLSSVIFSDLVFHINPGVCLKILFNYLLFLIQRFSLYIGDYR